ncbi:MULTISPECIES: hypothetical protein [Kitasatospora]|uniref:Uncharacterized protein n=1 Tax=Kitasatospora cathayae TaxID=3004092 RepID=A0ABY7Q3B4_9ACTN|nr:hypothetical protein [Kitasatospora sp. HUAS 3-15]WBP87132.1 hypothetical protein O1G21_15630 [Kitasatospora sp. HUAS 3-15]
MGNIMITKMTGQTVVAASLRAARLRALAELGGTGLGLDATGVSVASVASVVSGLGHTDLCLTGGRSVEGTVVETGLSRDWASVGFSRPECDERPTQAPKAAVAAAMHGGYAQVIGAGNAQKQNEQQINQAAAAFIGAKAIRMRAFRGPEPWRERT